MRDFLIDIKREAGRVRLSSAEKQSMRKAILAVIAENSPSSAREKTRASGFRGAEAMKRGFLGRLFRRAVSGVAAALLIGIGTSFAAERSLPGDLLYPVKVSVNERVRIAAAFSSETKTSALVEVLERRLEEATELSLRGELTPEANTELVRRFDDGAKRLAAALEKLDERGRLGAAASALERLSVTVPATREVLGRLSGNAEGLSATVAVEADESIGVRAEKVFRAAEELRESLEEKIVVEARAAAALPTIAEKRIDLIEEKIKTIRDIHKEKSPQVSKEFSQEVEAVINHAEERTRDARKKLSSGDSESAFKEALESRRSVEEARRRIEVEVRTEELLEKYIKRRKAGGDREDSARGATTSSRAKREGVSELKTNKDSTVLKNIRDAARMHEDVNEDGDEGESDTANRVPRLPGVKIGD